MYSRSYVIYLYIFFRKPYGLSSINHKSDAEHELRMSCKRHLHHCSAVPNYIFVPFAHLLLITAFFRVSQFIFHVLFPVLHFFVTSCQLKTSYSDAGLLVMETDSVSVLGTSLCKFLLASFHIYLLDIQRDAFRKLTIVSLEMMCSKYVYIISDVVLTLCSALLIF